MDAILDFYDIYDYYTIPFWQTTWFMVLIAILIIMVIGAVCLFLLHKKNNQQPWQWAEQELSHLANTPLIHKADYKKFYFALTKIIKGYLHKQYLWMLHDKTDEELIAFLVEKNADPEIIEMLKKIADGALWIKFANAQALKSQADADIQTVHMMIEKIKAPPQAPQ